MIKFLKSRPLISVAMLMAAACLPLFANRSNTSAQTAQKTCSTNGAPATVIGRTIAPDSAHQVGLFVFPHTQLGDTYLQSLSGATTSVGNAGTLSATLGKLNTQFQNEANLKYNLPSLYASMYAIGTNVQGDFSCAGLPAGDYSFLAFVQPIPGAAATPLPTANPSVTSFSVPKQSGALSTVSSPNAFKVPSQSQAFASVSSPRRVYYYSWVRVSKNALIPLPTPTLQKGKPATAATPRYNPVRVFPFEPISTFPKYYFPQAHG